MRAAPCMTPAREDTRLPPLSRWERDGVRVGHAHDRGSHAFATETLRKPHAKPPSSPSREGECPHEPGICACHPLASLQDAHAGGTPPPRAAPPSLYRVPKGCPGLLAVRLRCKQERLDIAKHGSELPGFARRIDALFHIASVGTGAPACARAMRITLPAGGGWRYTRWAPPWALGPKAFIGEDSHGKDLGFRRCVRRTDALFRSSRHCMRRFTNRS